MPSGTFGFQSKCGKTGYGGCGHKGFHGTVAARPGILSYSPTSICNGTIWYGMRHVEAGHTYLAKAMTTFVESDSKTNNDEKGTHAIIMSGKVTFSQRSLTFGKGIKISPVVYTHNPDSH